MKLCAGTKQMVEKKIQSWTVPQVMQRRPNGGKWYEVQLTKLKRKQPRKCSKSCWQKNQFCRKQLKVKNHLAKRAEAKIIKNAEQEIKEKFDRFASNAGRGCRSGTPGNARGAPTEHFEQKDIYKYVHIVV